MKKLLLIAIVGALAGSVFADDETLVFENRPIPFQLGIASPMGYPWGTDLNVKGCRLTLPYGCSSNIRGADIGIAGIATGNVTGFQLSCYNQVEGLFKGCQSSILINYTAKNVYGLQAAGLLNWIFEDSEGVQFAAINIAGVFTGAQVGVLVNWCDGQFQGLSLGLVNAIQADVTGCNVGFVNYCKGALRGCQVGCFNMAYGHSEGLQLGLFNAAEHHTGVQLGLLNLNVRGQIPLMAIVNVNFR